jgi:subtilisin family serine protease
MRITRELLSLVLLLLLPAYGGGGAHGAEGGGVASRGQQGEDASQVAARAPLPPHVTDEVIVRFRGGLQEFDKSLARSRLSGARLRAFRILDGLEHHRLPRNVSVEEAIAKYRQDPDVLYAEPNYIVRTTNTPNDPRFEELWGLYNNGQSGGIPGAHIDALSAWNVSTGSASVVVAVIDTGIDYNHPDLSANMFRNSADCNANGVDDDGNGRVDDCFGIDTVNGDSDPLDDNRHGSHVAGTIGAVGNNEAGIVGVNWRVSLMACKFLDAGGFGTTAGAIACLEYVKTMKDRGVNIVATNNSWGGGGFSQALFDAIQRHQQAGILFIAAAGNGNVFGVGLDTDQNPFYPCVYGLPNIICVAATTREDDRASFSNYGRRSVHVGAPGTEILSTTPGDTYQALNGTSMATPHVTGTAALLKAADPARDWRAIRNLVLAGGDDVASMASTITQKRLNAFGALTCTNSSVFSRLTPVADTVAGSVGAAIGLSVLNIHCAVPNGDVAVTVSPGGEVVTLRDDGLGRDPAAGDGNYSGEWTPPEAGSFTLTFPDGSVVAVPVSTPLIDVTPNSLDFGSVNAGTFVDRTFTVKNVGSGVLSGSASTAAPFSILSGGSYGLSAGASATVSVRFSPTATGSFSGTVSFAGGGGASKVVTGVALPPVSLATSPSTVIPGATVTASWTGIAAPSAIDWIGLFVPGAPNTPSLAWRYTTGTASGSVPLTLPATLAPGTYELRVFSNGGYTRLAVSNSFTVTAAVVCEGVNLSMSPTSVPVGGSVTATWSGICTPTAGDWIGLYAPGAPDTPSLAWRYITGTAGGNVPFTLPATLAPGTYELRLFSNGGYTRLKVSNTFTVTAAVGCSGVSLGTTPTSVPAGGSVTATWSGICAPSTGDWIGLFAPGAADMSYLAWRYTTGTASGSAPFAIPATLAPGTYELRLFSNGGFTRLALNSFTVTAVVGCAGTSLSMTPTTVAAGGSVTATWSGICAPTGGDWIGLYAPGAPDAPSLAWRYTTGTASGSVPFTIPATLAPGTYELRLFSNGGYTRLAVGNSFTVTACGAGSFSTSPTSVSAGGSATATWSGICTPTAGDWIGLYAPGAPDTSYLAWRYTTGTASGSVPFAIPATLAPGTYELRLFSNGGYTRLRVSNTFTVTAVVGCAGTSRCAPTGADWMARYPPGARDTAYLAWRYHGYGNRGGRQALRA